MTIGGAGRGGRMRELRQAEIKHLHGAVRPHLDVRGFEIAMNDPLFMRRFERLRDLLRDRQRLVDRDRPAHNALRQVLALDELHHQRTDTVGFFETVDVGDVGMIQ